MKSVSKIGRKYGWIPSLPDQRAKKFSNHMQMLSVVPTVVDMRSQCPPVYDQGQLGSCSAHASGGLAEFLHIKEGKGAYTPSRLFIYYCERVLKGTINEDSGASLSDAIHVLTTNGAPHESLWWYDVNKFTVKPSKKVYADGLLHKVSNPLSLDNTNLSELKSCLASGYPIMIGFSAYESFESQQVAQTGIVPMPQMNEQLLGGHAVLIVGYDDTKQMFIVRNSWGANWGISGYCEMPFSYLTNPNLASDFWSATAVA